MGQMRNAADRYLNNTIQTASPAKLILMLYDGAIRFCNVGLEAIEENNIEKANTNIKKARAIIVQLRMDLDMKYPVAQEFDTVYDYIFRRLVEANQHKDAEILSEALKHIKTMRDTWVEVMKVTNTV